MRIWVERKPRKRGACIFYPWRRRDGGYLQVPKSFGLTRIQAQVLEAVAAGLSNKQISFQLHVSRQGLDYHLSVLRKRLAAPNRCALIARAYELGVFPPGVWPPEVHSSLVGG
ncbi:response regulator transcription factor [Streptomyces sp. NPDC006879]|uniref:response regulator transcription factor n=1 Tax=Streptomyces sp. NPDC006879 TaxID=3364767 RepID=UPI0036D18A7D